MMNGKNVNLMSGGSGAPPKPWERAGTSSSGPSPFRPPSGHNSTAAVVESSGVSDSNDKTNTNGIGNNSSMSTQNGMAVNRPMPPRPWERTAPGGKLLIMFHNNLHGLSL